ncbi:MAG: YgfZ/GcvT domain-containing protein [Terrimicrobiaceae bacterium]
MSGGSLERLRILREKGGCFPVSGKIRISLSGEDRFRYLNGQVTVDVTRLQQNFAKQALLLSAKGKICAPLQVWREADTIIVEVEESLREDALARLEKYIISDDVALTVLENKEPVFHVFGSPAPDSALRINRLGTDGFDTVTEPAGFLMADPAEIEFLRIERAIPAWGRDLDSNTLPQEARLETSSVEFDKGCYVGQETVSRLKSVGRVNRLLYPFVGTLEPTSEERLNLYLPGATDAPVGVLTSRCQDFELAQTLALGYLNRQFEDSSSFVVADASGKILGKFEKRPTLT